MIKRIIISALVLVSSVHLSYAMENISPSEDLFPTTWQELIGQRNLEMLFVGNSMVYSRSKIYVAKVAYDRSLFETLKNPDNPNESQKYQLTKDGLRYDLKFNQHKQMQGILDKFEKQETEHEITWIFKGLYNEEEVVHQFIIQRDTGALKIRTDLGGHRHAEVDLVPQSETTFKDNYMRNAMATTLFGK